MLGSAPPWGTGQPLYPHNCIIQNGETRLREKKGNPRLGGIINEEHQEIIYLN